MKAVVAILGILLALGGTLCGVLNWILSGFYLESVNWEGPMMIVNNAAWILNILGVGLGVVLIGISAMMRPPKTL